MLQVSAMRCRSSKTYLDLKLLLVTQQIATSSFAWFHSFEVSPPSFAGVYLVRYVKIKLHLHFESPKPSKTSVQETVRNTMFDQAAGCKDQKFYQPGAVRCGDLQCCFTVVCPNKDDIITIHIIER